MTGIIRMHCATRLYKSSRNLKKPVKNKRTSSRHAPPQNILSPLRHFHHDNKGHPFYNGHYFIVNFFLYVTLDHKTSHKCHFLWNWTIFGRDAIIWKSGIWGCKKKHNIEKIIFEVVQMKFLAMHITNQKLRFDIFTVGNLHNIFMERDLYLIS